MSAIAAQVATHRLRRLFESAIASPSGRDVPLVWRWYLRFELLCGNPQAARRVFMRAVSHCPWSKALWLDAVRRLRPYLGEEEERDLMRAFEQRGLCVRTPLPVIELPAAH